MYDLGKEMLLKGVQVAPAYAPVCAEKGLVTLAIDSWCFGERKHEKDGHEGEENAFKLMLWKGQVLYGMMMFDEFRAMDYLASRPEVDDQRLGDRKSTRLNSSHITISYAVFCLKKKTKNNHRSTRSIRYNIVTAFISIFSSITIAFRCGRSLLKVRPRTIAAVGLRYRNV